ncbi:alpha/beta-Hydrolases superfamily protein [Rhynchospora pubera]|uniref:Alpha/beta-Hydrolases superfamily protein n=1 Tax=Rhynchospora pubera TaxID=906938 RepID=A0AAV8F474_9POAL|nr:alpha/beta-Hydrolases superfamily protein [Rhynchospora pubera]KAJ4787909.1 alpha/beta-Hydrolases superfamily protein [Rhynchospora pubera]
MATGGNKGGMEKLRRCVRTLFFMLTMVASLLVASAPALVALGDIAVSVALASRLTSASASAGRHVSSSGLRGHLREYGFRTSLLDIPLVSILRSLIITCVYTLCDGPGLSHGPYLGTVTFCALISVLVLSIKACLYAPYPLSDIGPQAPPSLPSHRVHMRKAWGMPVLFLSSLVFALGHIVVAYRTSCRARKKLLFHRSDPEAALVGKKVPRSPLPFSTKFYSKSDNEARRRSALARDENDLPISCLADSDSQFITIKGISIHFKLSRPSPPSSHSISLSCPHSVSDDAYSDPSLYTPLLSEPVPDELPNLGKVEGDKKFGVVLVHGFGGGVFSWRHVSGVLARQVGATVVAFDRPGWGLTSRPRRKDWEERRLPNPYKLESQVELLISFCVEMGFSSVVFVGHDDGGLLALKATERIQSSPDSSEVEVKGVVLISASLSREVVPGFARILLHTPLGKKHMVRPLLRTEITQVVNRRAWYDSTKLTTEILSLYKMPLFVEGWDEALHEIGRMSFATVLSPQHAADLLKSVHDLPVLVVAGAEDVLVSLKSAQAMASKFANSRLVAISGCGHLPHEECPKALLSALSPFISRLSSEDALQIH